MPNELIVNVTLGETRVARMENGAVVDLFIERSGEQGVVGNIYKGKVVRVLPGMQAAFVDIGLERTAFLHASDVLQDLAYLNGGELDSEGTGASPSGGKKTRRHAKRKPHFIENVIKEGKDILVQVEKEPMGSKGARLTSHLSLPGRYLVYLPSVNHIGISRRIAGAAERARLKEIITTIHKASGGFIVRTVAEGVTEKELKDDVDYLTALWKAIEKKALTEKPAAVIHSELDVLGRAVRDYFTWDIDRLVIDSPEAQKRVKDFIAAFMPHAKSRIEIYAGSEPIFDAFGVEVEITRALGQKVWLKSGGYVIIEQTEALTTIDVNTGRFVGRSNVEDTILKTNLEAVKEIVYQLRLRNIGGIIILDFIDMERSSSRQKVFAALKEALKADRARTTITKISELGLVEMTRERSREDLRHQLTNSCQYCEGKGYLKSPVTICYEIFRDIQREAPQMKGREIFVRCHPSIAQILYDDEHVQIEELEKNLKKRIIIKGGADYHVEQFDITE